VLIIITNMGTLCSAGESAGVHWIWGWLDAPRPSLDVIFCALFVALPTHNLVTVLSALQDHTLSGSAPSLNTIHSSLQFYYVVHKISVNNILLSPFRSCIWPFSKTFSTKLLHEFFVSVTLSTSNFV